MELTLSEKTYLSDTIDRLRPDLKDKSYELAGAFTRPQRGLFLGLITQKKYGEAKDVLENIIAFQSKIINK